MVYELESNVILFEIDRTAIVDISTGDTIKACCLSDAEYTWTEQDAQFLESNPDARVFIKFSKEQGNKFQGLGLTVFPEAVF